MKEQFPEHEVEVIDISSRVRKRPGLMLGNSISTLLLYGKDIVLRRRKFRLAFWRTPYIFHRIRKLVRDQVKSGNYVFSFQMQSLFDASTPGIPHFVYTDHTHLENLNYAANGRGNLYAPEWVALESVFCLPTHLEPFGIVFIEAMTARLSIVTTRVGAIPDFVEEEKNGQVVKVRRVDESI